MDQAVEKIFTPTGIAVIGASRNEKSIGHGIVKNLEEGNFSLYPVNPKADQILGLKCYAAVKDINHQVDLAFIAIPRGGVVPVMQECADKGIKAVVVLSAGFKEVDEEGEQLEAELVQIATQNKMALLGPNCLGVINTADNVRLNGTFAKKASGSGNISFISQSGAVGVYALEYANNQKIDFAKFASLGNKAVTTENDILRAYIEDDQTRVILVYLEDFDNPQFFLDLAAARLEQEEDKPLIVLKAGGSKSGKRAAASHTGALAENDEMLDHLFEQYGIIRVQNLEEMFYAGQILSSQQIPQNNRLCILTNAGGPGIITADAAEKAGLQVPVLSDELQEALAKNLPPTVSVGNPIDLVGDATPERYEKALTVLLKSDEIDFLLFLCTPQMVTNMEEIASTIGRHADEARENKKMLVADFADFASPSKLKDIFVKNNVPYFNFGNNAVQACAAAAQYRKYKDQPKEQSKSFEVKKAATKELIEEAKKRHNRFLTEPEVYQIFEAYGFDIAPYKVVTKEEELSNAARELGFPLVAKVVSKDVIHKSDAGGVVTGIKDEQALDEAFKKIHKDVRANEPDAEIRGILLQKMVSTGIEFIAGAQYKEKYGHLIMFGLGGIFVELIEDVTFRRAPITPYDSREMIAGIRSKKALSGVRGKPGPDKDKLAACLMRLSQLVMDFPEVEEIDINPVFGGEASAIIADARLIVRE